jgi:hypothetical protein
VLEILKVNTLRAARLGVFTKVQVDAKVAELVDALDLGSSGATRESSSLSFRTIFFLGDPVFIKLLYLINLHY